MGIGKVLQNLIERRNTNVNEVAGATGVSPSTLYSIIKRDSTSANIQDLYKVAHYLGVSLDYFYTQKDIPFDYASEEVKNKERPRMASLGELDVEILNKCASFPSPEMVKQHISGYLDFLASESLVFSDDLSPDDDEILQAHTEEIEKNQNSSSRKAAR